MVKLIPKHQRGSAIDRWLAEDAARTPQQRAVIAHGKEPGFGQRMKDEAWATLNTIGSLTPAAPLLAANEAGRQFDKGNVAGGLLEAGTIALPFAAGKAVQAVAPIIAKKAGPLMEKAMQTYYRKAPWTFKPTPDAYYRIVRGDEAAKDIIDNKVIRSWASRPDIVNERAAAKIPGKIDVSGANRPTGWPSFAKGSPSMEYAKGDPNHMLIETTRPMAVSNKARHGAGSTMFPVNEEGRLISQFPASEATIYKPNLLLGYKKVSLQKKGGKLSKEYIEKARKKPGGSNVGKKTFASGAKRTGPYAGPSGGAPKGSYPIPDIGHAKAALKLSGHAPNPAGIKAAVYRKYPELKK